MYIIYVEPLPDIKPRMFAVGFKRRPGDLGTTAIVLADAPGAALEKAYQPAAVQVRRPPGTEGGELEGW